MLDERKLNILYAIINSYISTAEPIGSRTISKQYDFGISSATIRNEMSDLEELGYLEKAHSSSGRIPSGKAYRHYVDYLMDIHATEYMNSALQSIKVDLARESNEIEGLIETSTKILSAITNYTAVSIMPSMVNATLKHFELVRISEQDVIVIFIYDIGVVKNTVLRLKDPITEKDLEYISGVLRKKLIGLKASELHDALATANIFKGIYEYRDFITKIIPIINKELEDLVEIKVRFNGLSNIFKYPEYKNIDRAEAFINFLESNTALVHQLSNRSQDGIHVTIGEENISEELANNTIITDTFTIGSNLVGKIGIIGPTRMEYKKVISEIYTLTKYIDSLVKNR